MKIDLIKLKFDGMNSYKYKPFKYCCDEIQNNKGIIFTNEDITSCKYVDEGNYFIPQFCTSVSEIVGSWGDEFEQTNNYPIQFCPHCGEKIEINVIDEIDVSEKYKELSKQRSGLWKKCDRTDSKKKEAELSKQVHELDREINGYYLLGEWDEDKYKQSK